MMAVPFLSFFFATCLLTGDYQFFLLLLTTMKIYYRNIDIMWQKNKEIKVNDTDFAYLPGIKVLRSTWCLRIYMYTHSIINWKVFTHLKLKSLTYLLCFYQDSVKELKNLTWKKFYALNLLLLLVPPKWEWNESHFSFPDWRSWCWWWW